MPAKTLPYYRATINPDPASDMEVNFIGLVDKPAIERNFQAFNAAIKKIMFSINGEKRIIAGPAMIADMPIYRKDDQLGEYYVVFDKQAIRSIVEKFSAKGYLKNFNLFHNPQHKVNDVTIFNSFISDKDLGVAPMVGFEDLADGSWFISAKVNNQSVWDAVKAGTIKGFSVEGLFNYEPAKFSLQTTKQKIQTILRAAAPDTPMLTLYQILNVMKVENPKLYKEYLSQIKF